MLVDATLTGSWPTSEDWRLLEYILNQDVASLFQNTKMITVESAKSLNCFIDKVFNLKNTWTTVLGFKFTTSWQYDFLTMQLFFQYITLIRQTGVEGNHRQELTNRVLFGFHPTDSFPLKQHLRTEEWKQYKICSDSTVNKAVKISFLSRSYQSTTRTASAGKQNCLFSLDFGPELTIRSLTVYLFTPSFAHHRQRKNYI